jgi:hypothetical protein
MRPDGKPGKLKIEFREKLLEEILELQSKTNFKILFDEDLDEINNYWEGEE